MVLRKAGLVWMGLVLLACSELALAIKPVTVPSHLAGVHPSALKHQWTSQLTGSGALLLSQIDTHLQPWVMRLPGPFNGERLNIERALASGDTHKTINQQFQLNKKSYHIIYTQGQTTGLGEIFGDGKHWYFEVSNNNVWTVDVTESRLMPGIYDHDVVMPEAFAPAHVSTNTRINNEITIVDILLLFTPNIQQVYPGEMSQTLMNQLIAKANQSFVDSDIHMQLRLVGAEFVNYTAPSNFIALDDLNAVLSSGTVTNTGSSLVDIPQRREALGADIVAMIRTHDLNEREVCGVAFFPNQNSDVLINISNVGISGGSNCLNTFTHEIGHNFGAGHQRFNDTTQGFFEFSGALVVRGQYNTLMSSIGTGDINRDFKLPVFSNLDNSCGGQVCGDVNTADNARTMNLQAEQNANLRPTLVPGEISIPEKSTRDSDNDGVFDALDAFPFLASESIDSDGDGTGDNEDAFPNDENESLDTDSDGVGNNADTDDDNDGVLDNEDALPLDSRDFIDADNDTFGQSRDPVDNDFQEVSDADGDGIGDVKDPDDDNDGVPDFYANPTLEQSQAIVVSAGNDSLLFYNSEGDFVSTAARFLDGGLSFRSDLAVGEGNRLYVIAFSDVVQLDTRPVVLRETINRGAISTNFPAHIMLVNDTISISHGFGVSYIETFDLTSGGNQFTSSSPSIAIFRDIAYAGNNTGYVTLRDENRIATFTTNAANVEFPSFANSGMDKPEHLAIDNDGRVFVTNAGNNTITYYSNTGSLLGTFVEAQSGGLGTPGCLLFGPDENLYVCSTNTHQILRYDGQTGAFLDVFIDGSNGTMQQPVGIQFMSLPLDDMPFSGEHDSDGDGVNNNDDALPLDPTETLDTDGDGRGNNADEDDDNDGMPDAWELEFGFNPLNASDASQDADGDGFSNVQEYNNATNPLVAQPIFEEPPIEEPTSSSGGSLGWYSVLLMLLLLLRQSKKRIVC